MRSDFRFFMGDVAVVLFDFDGTLTASPGDAAVRCKKSLELTERAPLLAPRLQALQDAAMTLGIISRSSEQTINNAIDQAGLRSFFAGPVRKVGGLEGKAGFIEELWSAGELGTLGPGGLRRVLLIDDDVRELERARARGLQTFAAPAEGGLQVEDFDEIFDILDVARSDARQVPSLPQPADAAPPP